MLVASTVTLPACQRTSVSMVDYIRQAVALFEYIHGFHPNTIILHEGELQQLREETPNTLASFDGMEILLSPAH